MTDLNLDDLRAKLEQTRLPWTYDPDEPGPNGLGEIEYNGNREYEDVNIARAVWAKDASLIVAAVNALPQLLAIADAARRLPDFVTSDAETKADALSRINLMLRDVKSACGEVEHEH